MRFLRARKKGQNHPNGTDRDKPKSIYQIAQEQIETGLAEYKRSSIGLSISAFAAGMEVGFSIFLMSIIYTLFHGQTNEYLLHFYVALAYPIGFIFVIIGRSELFTEHTTLAVLPVLNRSAHILDLLKIWGIIFVGNLLGGYLIGLILVFLGPKMKLMTPDAFYYLAIKMVDYDWKVILGSSLLAGWLMGLLSWLVTSSQESISRIIVVLLVTSVIGMGGLHHSIVGSIEVFTGLISNKNISFSDYIHFQIWTTLGNAIGGSVFVALIKYGTTNWSQQKFSG